MRRMTSWMLGMVLLGATAFGAVDPVGRVYNATELFEEDVRTDFVRTSDVLTFYTRFGDLVGNAAAFAAALFVLVALGRTRRRRSLDPSRGVV